MSQNDDNDQNIVSDIYKTAAKTEPSEALDTSVLNMAREQSRGKNITESQSQNATKANRPRFFMKWQYSGSIAASILLISFLFVSHYPEDFAAIPQSTSQNQVPMQQAERIRMRATDAMMSEPEIQNAQSAERADSFSELASEAMSASKMRLEAAPVNQKELAALQAEAEFILAAIREKALVNEDSKNINSVSTDIQATSFQDAEQAQASLQTQLFETLKKLKENDPNFKLDASFKAVLSEQQIASLTQ